MQRISIGATVLNMPKVVGPFKELNDKHREFVKQAIKQEAAVKAAKEAKKAAVKAAKEAKKAAKKLKKVEKSVFSAIVNSTFSPKKQTQVFAGEVEENVSAVATASPEAQQPEPAGEFVSSSTKKRACVELAFHLVDSFIEEVKTGFRNESLLVEIKKDEGIVKYQLSKLLHAMQVAGVTMSMDNKLKEVGEVALPKFSLPEFVNLYSYKTNQDEGLKPDHDKATLEPFVFDELIDANGVVSVHALESTGEVVVQLITSRQREERDSVFTESVSAEFMTNLEAKEREFGLAPTVVNVAGAEEPKAAEPQGEKPVVKKSKVSPAMKDAFDKANARKSHSK